MDLVSNRTLPEGDKLLIYFLIYLVLLEHVEKFHLDLSEGLLEQSFFIPDVLKIGHWLFPLRLLSYY